MGGLPVLLVTLDPTSSEYKDVEQKVTRGQRMNILQVCFCCRHL